MLKKMVLSLLTSAAFGLLLLSTPAQAASCDFEKVSFSAAFAGGKLSHCKKVADHHYQLTTVAEDYPINPSPWYAFTVQSKGNNSHTVQITLAAEQGRARYLPKISRDAREWQTIPFTVVNNAFEFKLDVTPQPLYVAGQELMTAQHYQQWMAEPRIQQRFSQKVIGQSREGRDIVALEAKSANNHEWLLIIGRQHPPELTGAVGLLAFVDELVQQDTLQQAFFERFNVLVVPMVNPDGVANGNWRHNMGGKDLNRDWVAFEQPETRAVHDYLKRILDADQQLVFALDFHSTQQDIFYTQAAESGAVPSTFVDDWLAALKPATASSFTLRERASHRPESTVFRRYIVREYGVHAVTYEFGDNTTRSLVRQVSQQSAIELQQLLLATPSEAFIPSKTD